MNCDIDPLSLCCRVCGAAVSAPHVLRNCDGRRGLGDMVAFGLSAIGITKERVSSIVGRPCGCGERQAAMNQAGYRWQHAMMRPYYRARDLFLNAYYRLQSSRLRMSGRFAWMAVRVLIYGR